MDSNQLRYLVAHDSYLKKYSCSIITDIEIPFILPQNELFFILTSIRKKKNGSEGKGVVIGHWVLIDSLNKSKSNKKQITYFDPYGSNVTSVKVRNCLKRSLLYHKATLNINRKNYQHKYSTICGPIVAYIALLRARGFTLHVIQKKKLSKNLLFIVKVVPDLISFFLPKQNRMLKRFSLDFL